MTTPRVLVLWAELDSPNFGVRVLAEGVLHVLPADVDTTFASHHNPLRSGSLSVKSLLFANAIPWSTMRREVASFDLVIDLGEGDSFTTIYGPKRFAKQVLSKRLVNRSKAPLILGPQTLGPWTSRVSRSIAKRVLMRTAQVWARDSDSVERTLALATGPVHLATDLAFALPPPGQPLMDQQHVLVNVSGLLWNPNPHVDHSAYRQLITESIDRALSAGIELRLLVHVAHPGSTDDDAATAVELSERFGGLEVVQAQELGELRGRIAEARLVVASRMHACLNALSLGVPTLPLAYSDKFEHLFGDLGYHHTVDLRSQSLPPHVDIASAVASESLRVDAAQAASRGQSKIALFEDAIRDLVRKDR